MNIRPSIKATISVYGSSLMRALMYLDGLKGLKESLISCFVTDISYVNLVSFYSSKE